MPTRPVNPRTNDASSGGWTVVWLLAMLGIALTSQYLFPGSLKSPDTSRASRSRSADEDAADRQQRSRHATTPSEISRTWRDILLRLYSNVSKHRILSQAAGMTYYSILAIFPAIAALVAVYGLFSDPSTIAKHLDLLGGFLPGGAIDVAREQLTRVASKGSQSLGLTFLIGLGISLWSANAAMKSLFDTLNIVYAEDEKRGFVNLNATSLGFTVSGIILVMAALGSIVVVPLVLNYVGLSNVGDFVLRIGRWPAMYLILTFTLAVIYRYGPCRRPLPRWRWITWGSAMTALLWLAASGLFSWYAANFGKFNQTYGSLGAVVGFMTWLWISAIVILLGAEIDVELESPNAVETRTGSPRPTGVRAAAETVGAARGT